MYANVYEWFVRDVFFERQWKWEDSRGELFGQLDYKKFLCDYFNIDLP